MRSLYCILIIAGLYWSAASFAQDNLTRQTESFYTRAMNEINQRHINWVKTTAAGQKQNFSVESTFQQANAYGKSLDFSTIDIDYLVTLVMILVSKDTQQDLNEMLKNLEKLKQQKKQLSDALSRVNNHRVSNQEMRRSTYDSLKRLTQLQADAKLRPTVPDSAKKVNPVMIQVPPKVSPAEMDQLKIQLQKQLDPLNVSTENTATRVQELNNKRTGLNVHISTQMKKISPHQDSIIQKLK